VDAAVASYWIRQWRNADAQTDLLRGDDALLFAPARGGCHLKDRTFNKDVVNQAVKDVGREGLSARPVPARSVKNTQLATLTGNTARLGHKTVAPALRYPHS
jgi:hypothetical protein